MDTRIAGSGWRHVGLDSPRSGLEKRVWSPRPQWAGGAVDPAMRGLFGGGCCGRHVGDGGRGRRVQMGL